MRSSTLHRSGVDVFLASYRLAPSRQKSTRVQNIHFRAISPPHSRCPDAPFSKPVPAPHLLCCSQHSSGHLFTTAFCSSCTAVQFCLVSLLCPKDKLYNCLLQLLYNGTILSCVTLVSQRQTLQLPSAAPVQRYRSVLCHSCVPKTNSTNSPAQNALI
jgi:hypothetical protein